MSKLWFYFTLFIAPSCFAQAWQEKITKAETLYGRHEYLKSLAYAEEGYELWRNSTDTTLNVKLYIHGVLELIYETTGFFGKAETFYYKDLHALNASGKKVKTLIASLKLNLAELYMTSGRYDQADFFIQELISESDSSTTAFNKYLYQKLNGSIRFYLGDLETAEKIFIQLLKRQQDKNDNPSYDTEIAALTHNLAFVYDEMKRYQESDSLYQIALDIARNAYGEQGSFYSSILNNLGSLYLDTKRFREAEDMFTKALRLKEKSGSKNHPGYGIALNNLGLVYKSANNTAKAKDHFRRALTVFEKAYRIKGAEYMNVLEHLAETEALEKNFTVSDNLFADLITLRIDYINNVFSFLSEKEKANFYFSTQGSFSLFRTYALERSNQNPAILEDLLNLQLKTKGWLFGHQAQIRRTLATTRDPQLLNNYRQWREKKQIQMKALQDPEFTDEDRNVTEKEINDLEKKISLLSKTQQKHIHWKQLRKLLKVDEAAIEIFMTGDEKEVGRYGALVFTQNDSLPRLIPLGTTTELEGRNFKYYQNCIKQKIKDDRSYDIYWKRIADLLGKTKKVFVSADGVYQKINLITLLNPSNGKYQVDELTTIYLTNLQEINAEVRDLKTKDALLIGYPDYNTTDTLGVRPSNVPADSLKRFFGENGPSLLPGTLIEVKEAKTLLETKGIATAVFSHQHATESVLKNIKSPTILHIATHGFFLNSEPKNLQGPILSGMNTNFVRDNPMIRSGLLLAGSGSYLRKRTSTTEDGIHTAFEASNLNLDSTRLVVLSACETGLGEIKNGEGVYGLQRAFSVAGARSVLMSLWKVDDNATQELMVNFYRNWKTNESPADAFYSAVKIVKDKYVHPYYWGAFILSGQ